MTVVWKKGRKKKEGGSAKWVEVAKIFVGQLAPRAFAACESP